MPTKPHSLEIRFAGEDYTPDQPQPDIRVENFCALLAHGKSKRAAVILSFPNASKDSASFRASRILSDDRVRDRLAYLRAKIAQATATVSPALSQSVRDSLDDAGGPDVSNEPISGAADNSGRALDNLGHSDVGGGQNVTPSVKRRTPPPPDLTPAELRRIIAEGARNGNSSAINAAIKILDTQMQAPPQVADPAGLCAILFNGGGGGETPQHIVNRLFSVYGERVIIDCVMQQAKETTLQIVASDNNTNENAKAKEGASNVTYPILCDTVQGAETICACGHGADTGSIADADPAGGEGRVGGEGGESRAAEEV